MDDIVMDSFFYVYNEFKSLQNGVCSYKLSENFRIRRVFFYV